MPHPPSRGAAAGLLTWLALSAPAHAYIINLGGTYVPGPGQAEVVVYRFHAPFTSRLEAGQLAPLAESYHWAEAWTAVEFGVGGGFSTMFVYPYDRVRAAVGGPERAGLAGFTFNLNKQLWLSGPYEGRLRLRTDVRATESGAPELSRMGLQHSQSLRFGDGRWRAYGNVNYFHSLPRPGADGTVWPGQQFELHSALEYNMNRHLSVIVEQLGSWQAQSTLSGLPNPASGSMLIQLAPGVTWMLSPNFALQASVALPVRWSGFQDVYPWTTTVGTIIDF